LELERKANGYDTVRMNQPNAPIPEDFGLYHTINRDSPIVRRELQGHKSEHHRITSARRLENRLRKR
jgi:hypothetical protein